MPMTEWRPELHSGRKVEGEIRGGTIDVNVGAPGWRATHFRHIGPLLTTPTTIFRRF